jgi:hypothetical protein
MRRTYFIGLGIGLLATACLAVPAHAQATRTWVSGVGDDVNPCSRTAPCKTFAGAISKTAAGGEINCLDPGGFGTLTITKSMTVDCTGTFGSTLNSGGINGLVINMSLNSTDVDRTVRLRGLSINGAGSTKGLNGIRIVDAIAVYVENVVIGNQSGAGIIDARTAGQTRLYVKNVSISAIGGTGIALGAPTAVNGVSIAVIDDVNIFNANFGIAVGASFRATVSRSVVAGNRTAGLHTDSGGFLTAMSVVSSNNSIGAQGLGQLSLSDSLISSNSNALAGTVTSFGNNRLVGNSALGGTLTPAGAASSEFGQQ